MIERYMIERYMIGSVDSGWWGIDVNLHTRSAVYHHNGHPGLPKDVPDYVKDQLLQMVLHGSSLENWMDLVPAP
jgi:hypothetical protein